MVAFATGIRWIGWGMAEPLFPVFLFSMLGSYGHSSVVDAAGETVFLIVLPMAGILADRVSIRRFLIGGLFLFFFDGLWSVAAATQVVVFALIANIIDGVAVASDVVGRATYVRRHARTDSLGFVMGTQNGIVNCGFVVGAIISLIAVRYVSLAWIFFGIVPTNLVALCLIWTIKNDDRRPLDSESQLLPVGEYWSVWRAALQQGAKLRGLAGLVLYFNALTGFATLLIPIYAYMHGAQLQDVVILGVVGVAPEVFGSFLGRIADTYRGRLLSPGLAAVGLCLAALGILRYSPVLLLVVLMFRSILVLLSLVIEIQVTARVQPERYGRVSSVVEGLKDFGKVAGTVLIGFAMDHAGANSVFFLLAVVTFLLGVVLFVNPTIESAADFRCPADL